MEILKFKFSDEDFSSVPTNNFLRYKENPSNLLAFQQEIFFKEENNHLPQEILDFATHNYIENVFESNSPNTLRPKISQKAKFSKKLPNKTLNPLIPKKKNLSNKFINPIKNQKSIKTDLNKRKKWNEDNKTNRLFQNLGTIKLNEEKIQKTNEEFSKKKVKLRENKESTERLKHKTYETTELLEESLMKKVNQKNISKEQINFKKTQIKEIKDQIQSEKHKKNKIYEKISTNIKTYQSKKSKNLSSKEEEKNLSEKDFIKSKSDNLLEIENYHPPKRSFIKDQPILSHEAFEKQMQIQKNKIAHLQTAEDENDKFPTKEDGLTLNSIQKAKGLTGQSTLHHYNPQFSSNLQNLKDNLEVKEKERLLENLIQKYKEEVIERKGVVNQNKYTKQVNNKIAYLKNDMEPILEHLRKNTKELTDYSFTSNILSNACSKLVCENSKELGEMIIGDILIEVVDILNENEVKKNNLEKNYKRKNVLDDFFEAMKGLQFDQDEILNRRCESWNNNKVREINTSEILIIDKKKYYNILEMTENFANKVLKDKLSIDSLMNEKNFSDKKFVSKTKQISESLVNEIIDEIYEEFEKAQNDFVEKIYEQEFFQK